MEDDIKEWITINHQHVPIKEGESKREALRNHLKKMSRVEKNKDKYDKIKDFKKKKKSNNKVEEEIEYLDLDEDFNKKYIKQGDKYILRQDLKEKYDKKLGKNNDFMQNFNASKDGTKYTMKTEIEKEIRKKLGTDKYN